MQSLVGDRPSRRMKMVGHEGVVVQRRLLRVHSQFISYKVLGTKETVGTKRVGVQRRLLYIHITVPSGVNIPLVPTLSSVKLGVHSMEAQYTSNSFIDLNICKNSSSGKVFFIFISALKKNLLHVAAAIQQSSLYGNVSLDMDNIMDENQIKLSILSPTFCQTPVIH